MIEPRRAPVRPRVLSPESGEELPLDQLIQSYLDSGVNRTVLLEGDRESAVVAMHHLAFVFPTADSVKLTTTPMPRIVVHASKGPPRLLVRCSMAPWRRDDWIEYLLAIHPTRCSSVMSRLAQAEELDPVAGNPQLWQTLLDLLAADDSLGNVQEAALRYAYSVVSDPAARLRMQAACLETTYLPRNLDSFKGKVTASGVDVFDAVKALLASVPPVLVTHRSLRLLIAADKLAGDLFAGRECPVLEKPQPRDFVRLVARLVGARPEALAHLRQLVANKRWSMAASALYAADRTWVPDPDQLPNLGGAYLRGVSWPHALLKGLVALEADLAGADFRHADLSESLLRKASLAGACLQQARLLRGNAEQANLARADLRGLRATGASFAAANLRSANLEDALLANANLEKAHLEEARLINADMRGATLEGARLRGADLSGAILTGANLRRLVLKESRCVGTRFAQANLSGCDLEGLELSGADFTDANLSGALLTGTSMPAGRLDGADLRGAGLAEVDWERASLCGADLTGASFHLGSSRSGRVGSVIAGEGSKTGFYTDDYNEQDFKAPEEIRKANLRYADLRGAILENVDLYLVDLRDAQLDPDQVEHARRCGAILKSRC